jgi:hypothetical protein
MECCTASMSSTVCRRWTPSAGPSWSRPLIGGGAGTAPVPMMSRSYSTYSAVPSGLVVVTVCAAASIAVVESQPQPAVFEVGDAAVREVAPVGDLAGEVVRDTADAEVRVVVGGELGDLGGGVDFAGAWAPADARVAAADDDQPHRGLTSPGERDHPP